MKKVCPRCGSNKLHKHGKKRRKCFVCGKTCSVKSGRKKTVNMEKYLLDRSTYRRISCKQNRDASQIMRWVVNDLKNISPVITLLKKT